MLAQQNVETLNEVGATKIVVTCAHCFNTSRTSTRSSAASTRSSTTPSCSTGWSARRSWSRSPARPTCPASRRPRTSPSTAATVTYHDPCYLGRHNGVYAPPRELIGALPGVELREMERTKEKSFCCGAGGARMWMEEKLGTRINTNRTEEAIATGAERIAIGCPFCRVMISDGLTAAQSEGKGEDVEVVDVAQMLLAAVPPRDDGQPARATGRSSAPGPTRCTATRGEAAQRGRRRGAASRGDPPATATAAAVVEPAQQSRPPRRRSRRGRRSGRASGAEAVRVVNGA